MGAFEEIGRRGDVAGPETLELLRRLGAQVSRSSSFPPPEGHDHWSDDAVDDLLADMFSRDTGRGQVFVLGCFTVATDQASLERLILASIRNHLKDEAKRTERGKLRRRLAHLLDADSRFVRPPILLKTVDAWALDGGPVEMWQGDIGQLQNAAASVRGLTITQWNTAGKTPAGTIHALVTVSYSVIDTAQGSVRDEDLARVAERRFVLIAPPVFIELPDGTDTIFRDAADPESQVLNSAHADRIWATLTETDRMLLPYIGAPIAEQRRITGLGPRATTAMVESLRERIRLATESDEQRADIVMRLADMSGGAR